MAISNPTGCCGGEPCTYCYERLPDTIAIYWSAYGNEHGTSCYECDGVYVEPGLPVVRTDGCTWIGTGPCGFAVILTINSEGDFFLMGSPPTEGYPVRQEVGISPIPVSAQAG